MTSKTITRVTDAPSPHWVGDGFFVRPLFADLAFQPAPSPFLMLDYAAPHEFGPSEKPPGVGAHPHKGFETVTIVYEGDVEHRDSAGNAGHIGPGDVQWMTAGSGLLHEEFHGREAARRGGKVSMAQLWVNLPARDKSVAPRYQDIREASIPRVPLGEGLGEARVIAGELQGARGPAQTFTAINVLDLRLAGEGTIELPIPDGHVAIMPVLAGRVTIAGRSFEAGQTVFLSHAGDGIGIETHGQAKVLLLTGEPIDEPIAAYGPFVMNTRDELMKAFAEFQDGKMGTL
jgi:hypothetical protein